MKTIVIVEDELLIARFIKGILEKEGYNVIINIKSVEEAIVAIELYKPIIVMIDVNLKNKEKDGVLLGHYLLKKDLIPYIYITSFTDKVIMNRIMETRPHGIVIKPFKPLDLTSTFSIVISNYKYKKIDVLRHKEEIIDEIPFMFKNVINYIDENIDKKIDLHELVKFTKWNYMHFIRMFSRYLNQTPYQYILKKKIEKASVLISNTDIPLTHIAADLSFSSYSNFCALFKREKGEKPDRYRKINSYKKYL